METKSETMDEEVDELAVGMVFQSRFQGCDVYSSFEVFASSEAVLGWVMEAAGPCMGTAAEGAGMKEAPT